MSLPLPSVWEIVTVYIPMVWFPLIKMLWPYFAALVAVAILRIVIERRVARRRYRGRRYLLVELDEE